MRKTGIWMDFNEANIFHLEDDTISHVDITSNVDTFKLKGGARSKKPYGPMDKTSESKHMFRRKQQEQSYYQNICDSLAQSDAIFIMGPAEAKVGFGRFLHKYPNINRRVQSIQTADSMTYNQKVKQVKKYFANQRQH